MRLAILPLIAAGVLMAGQTFIGRVQYFDAVSTSHPMPFVAAIEKFVYAARGVAPSPRPSAYDAEMQMSRSALLDRWNPLIEAASRQFGIPQSWIRTVMRMESAGRTMSSVTQPITSRAGAMGLMQVMPGTYAEMRQQYRLGRNAYDPHDNVYAGAAYLRWLHGKYGFPAMFAAYNDGPGHLEQHMQHGETLPDETRNYLNRISAILGGGPARFGRGRTVLLTRPNGEPVLIAAADVATVRPALPGEYAPLVRAVITVGREHQGVRENAAEVEAALSRPVHMAEIERPRRISVSYLTRS
ncbi:MAG: lytic transglycosylase domain-containing protein [Rhizomicrobium sp.]|jgi:hypothetical protein